MRTDAMPEREDMTLSYAQWCRERGYNPETRTYEDHSGKES